MGFLGYTYPSSDGPLSSVRTLGPKPNCMIWAHDPTIIIIIIIIIIITIIITNG